MSLTNSSTRYGLLTIFLHWSMAVVVYAMFALGLWMVGLSYYDSWYHNAPDIHKSIGVLLMLALVMCFRRPLNRCVAILLRCASRQCLCTGCFTACLLPFC